MSEDLLKTLYALWLQISDMNSDTAVITDVDHELAECIGCQSISGSEEHPSHMIPVGELAILISNDPDDVQAWFQWVCWRAVAIEVRDLLVQRLSSRTM